jgi:F0F1-type ATP synthase delta subunit
MLRDNQLDLLDQKVRSTLYTTLVQLSEQAPVIHMSFAVEPPSAMSQKIVGWFRVNVHPATLLQIGIQPTIAAGCVLRTPNKFFDFSLRQHLRTHQDKLMTSIQTHSEAGLKEVSQP